MLAKPWFAPLARLDLFFVAFPWRRQDRILFFLVFLENNPGGKLTKVACLVWIGVAAKRKPTD